MNKTRFFNGTGKGDMIFSIEEGQVAHQGQITYNTNDRAFNFLPPQMGDFAVLIDELIGRIVEPGADSSMGVVSGLFVPFPAYENVRSVFRLYAKLVDKGQDHGEKLSEYHKKRDVLTPHLAISTITGLPVKTLWIDILDFSVYLGDVGYEAHFCVDYNNATFFSDSSLWDRKKE